MRTIAEINDKIRRGKVVVLTAEEMTETVREKGPDKAAQSVDVVTTGTFGMMCSSGAFLNFGHAKPRMRMQKVLLNNVPAYSGIAAVDAYLGATEMPVNDPLNQPFPGEFRYGGAHVIEDLVRGKAVQLEAESYGTHCYPARRVSTRVTLKDLNQAYLYNPRNCYQNYNVATNLTRETRYTYMGILKPNMGNISYSGAGALSPLMNDPYLKTIGIGSRILIGGATGYVSWEGTQHDPTVQRNERGIPTGGAGTLALAGPLKGMDPRFIRGVSLVGYGASLGLGVSIPIPILNPEMAWHTGVCDADITAPVVDYGEAYPDRKPGIIAQVTFEDLKRGTVTINGRSIPAAPISSQPLARAIAERLKDQILNKQFFLTEPVAPLPGPADGKPMKSMPQEDPS